MSHYGIVTDLNRCVGCLACSVACKVINGVPIGSYWLKVLRIGPNPTVEGSGHFPDVEMYYLPLQCQHCKDPACVTVCPTEASHVLEDGTIQIDKEKCIGCQFCAMACPYGVRYLNADEGVVEKCTLCEQMISQGELPQCVAQCGGRARFFGDIEGNLDDFEGPGDVTMLDDCTYEDVHQARVRLGDYVEEYSESDIYHLPDVGNGPSLMYILRNRTWQGGDQ